MERRFGGFTLLELIVVIIIVGILSTLGLTQYGRVIEKSRGAEAKNILGTMRSLAAGYKLEKGSLKDINLENVGIGAESEDIPKTCKKSHYFWYNISCDSDTGMCNFTATRCSSANDDANLTGGKEPGRAPKNSNYTFVLESNISSGSDLWRGSGGY